MKKRVFNLVLVFAMMFACVPIVATAATSGTCGNNLTWTLDGDGTLTISGTGEMTNWERYSDVPWYGSCYDIKKVVIKNGVTSIGNCAFWDCSRLTSVEIPNSITSIGWEPFYDTAYANDKSNWEDDILYIGNYLIQADIHTSAVNIKPNTKAIAGGAFSFCRELTSVTIPNGVTSIGKNAFDSCQNLEDVYYSGSEAEWKNIAIGSDNEPLINATIHYNSAIAWSIENGITAETVETFAPDTSCTRSQIVTFIWRNAGSPEPTTNANPFTDVSGNDYYYKAVLWAVENGIISGTTNTTFSPNETCTRAQAVTFLWRENGEPSSQGSTFSDVANDAYYAKAVAWAVENGITVGTSTTTFSPNNNCTRGQIVTFLYRYIG
jgi:hypothetical protein